MHMLLSTLEQLVVITARYPQSSSQLFQLLVLGVEHLLHGCVLRGGVELQIQILLQLCHVCQRGQELMLLSLSVGSESVIDVKP